MIDLIAKNYIEELRRLFVGLLGNDENVFILSSNNPSYSTIMEFLDIYIGILKLIQVKVVMMETSLCYLIPQ